MPKIDFYVLPDAAPEARDRLACRVAEKAYELGHRVHIHTESMEDALHLDTLLWTFRDRSFVPHEIEPQGSDECPVTIGRDWTPSRCEVLINLARRAPGFFDRFERVAEIICHTVEAQNSGRERYRFYREQGCELRHHMLSR
jgi:DNA polymerase III subunit chi